MSGHDEKNYLSEAIKAVSPRIEAELRTTIEREITAPQLMSAVEYLKARVRMENWSNAMCGETASDACPSCDECPYDPELVPSYTDEEENPEKAVAIVEAWARKHKEANDER